MDVISNDVHHLAQDPLSKKPQEKPLSSLCTLITPLLPEQYVFFTCYELFNFCNFTAGPNLRRQSMHFTYLDWM